MFLKNKMRLKKILTPPDNIEDWYDATIHKTSKKPPRKSTHKSQKDFNHVSLTLCTTEGQILNNENNYITTFTSGVLEGSGIKVNKSGNKILFTEPGSYRFEIYGHLVPYSDVPITLQYCSKYFNKEILNFSNIPLDTPRISGLSTILPLNKNQHITIKFYPQTHESILLQAGLRLYIHRVA